MRKFILIIALAFASFACETNTTVTDVPTAVVTAFETAYPGATEVEWEEEGNNYEVEFMMNGEEMEVEFDANGNIIDEDED